MQITEAFKAQALKAYCVEFRLRDGQASVDLLMISESGDDTRITSDVSHRAHILGPGEVTHAYFAINEPVANGPWMTLLECANEGDVLSLVFRARNNTPAMIEAGVGRDDLVAVLTNKAGRRLEFNLVTAVGVNYQSIGVEKRPVTPLCDWLS